MGAVVMLHFVLQVLLSRHIWCCGHCCCMHMVGAGGGGGYVSIGKDDGESMATGPQKGELVEKRNLENV